MCVCEQIDLRAEDPWPSESRQQSEQLGRVNSQTLCLSEIDPSRVEVSREIEAGITGLLVVPSLEQTEFSPQDR